MATLFRRSAQMAARTASRRRFGSNANVQYEGAEAKLRAILPHDHQIVLAFLGSYGVLIGLSRAGGGDEPAPTKAPLATASVSTDGAVPSIADPSFDEWIKVQSPSNCVVRRSVFLLRILTTRPHSGFRCCPVVVIIMNRQVPGNADKYAASFE